MVLEAEETVPGAICDELAVSGEVLVVGGVDGVLVVTELQRKQSVFAPWYVGVHLDLCSFPVQVSVALPSQGTKVHLPIPLMSVFHITVS